MNFILAMLLAIVLVFLFGVLIEIILIRPTYGNDMYSLISHLHSIDRLRTPIS